MGWSIDWSIDWTVFLLQTPPLRILIMGAAGTGKTTHSKAIAEMVDGFIINVRRFMNEMATPKLQKPPVETFPLDQPTPYWRLPKIPLPGSENLPFVEKQLPAGLLPVKLPFLGVTLEIILSISFCGSQSFHGSINQSIIGSLN